MIYFVNHYYILLYITKISSNAPPIVLELNPDRSFFKSNLPSNNSFTENQKIEIRSAVLNFIKRMRNPLLSQNYEYPSNVSYFKPSHISVPMY